MTVQTQITMLLFILVVSAVGVALTLQRFACAQASLAQWMEQHDYTLLCRERRSVRRGPFFWTTSKNQLVYFVVVQDASGQQRRGWARCGGWWLGMMSNQVDVIWE